MQLVVLGMHRSGTSALTRVLNLMGAYFGPEGISTGFNRENPKGFWERRDVRKLNDFLLAAAGADWNRVSSFSLDAIGEDTRNTFEHEARKIILDLDAHRPWVLKEPRFCLLLPLWRKLWEVPVYVVIYRHPMEVARSLRTRQGYCLPFGLALWEFYICEFYIRSALAHSRADVRVLVDHRQLMISPLEAVTKLKKDLEGVGVEGLKMPSQKEIESFIDPALYREKGNDEEARAYLTEAQWNLKQALGDGCFPDEDPALDILACARENLAFFESLEAEQESVRALTEAGTEMDAKHRKLEEQLKTLQSELKILKTAYDAKEAALKNLEQSLISIKNSRLWKAGRIYHRLKGIATLRFLTSKKNC